jgi:hypothetical protein
MLKKRNIDCDIIMSSILLILTIFMLVSEEIKIVTLKTWQ